MLEKYKYVSAGKGELMHFFDQVQKTVSIGEIADLFGVSERTVRHWRNERSRVPLIAVKRLAHIANVQLPRDLLIQDRLSHLSRVGRLGGRAVALKYGHIGGDMEKRKTAWLKWWEEGGKEKYGDFYDRKSINKPKHSAKLAELCGILMGDGGISSRQVVVTLDSETDKEFASYVSALFSELFGVKPSVRKIKNARAVSMVVSRTELVDWLKGLGLPVGNKLRQGLDMPFWIKDNPVYSRACVRGLVDTDGSIFLHRYYSSGKRYTYKKLDFCSLSPALIETVYLILCKNGMNPYVSQGKKIRLESQKDVERYFEIIGTSNPKHLRRWLQ